MFRWTDENDYNKLLCFASSMQHKAYEKKYHSYNKFKFWFWNLMELVAFKIKSYIWQREVSDNARD